MPELPQPDGFLSAWDAKGVATDVIGEFPLSGIEGSPLDPGDIWPIIILASTNQTSVREVCAENHEAPCDDTVFDWLHTLDRGWLEFAANLPDGGPIDTSEDNDGPDVARIEGRALDPWQGELADHIRRYSFSVPCRKEAVWLR